MAVRKLDGAVVDARLGVTMKSDPTRIDPRKLKLGKSVARHDPRTLLLASYVTRTLPAPPASFDVTSKVKAWGMMDNDQIGDCTCAAAGHLLMEWRISGGSKNGSISYTIFGCQHRCPSPGLLCSRGSPSPMWFFSLRLGCRLTTIWYGSMCCRRGSLPG